MQSMDFMFNGISSKDMGIYNIRSNKQDPIIPLIGKRKVKRIDLRALKSNQISSIEYSPLVHKLELSPIDKPWDENLIRTVANWIYTEEDKPFESGDRPGIIYYCTAINDGSIELMNNFGSLEVELECNAGHGWTFGNSSIYSIDGTKIIDYFNPSNIKSDYYYPTLIITMNGGTSIEINNLNDSGNSFYLENLGNSETVSVDNHSGLIRGDTPLNYFGKCFPKRTWLRLVRGNNKLQITGKCTIQFLCEFPVA